MNKIYVVHFSSMWNHTGFSTNIFHLDFFSHVLNIVFQFLWGAKPFFLPFPSSNIAHAPPIIMVQSYGFHLKMCFLSGGVYFWGKNNFFYIFLLQTSPMPPKDNGPVLWFPSEDVFLERRRQTAMWRWPFVDEAAVRQGYAAEIHTLIYQFIVSDCDMHNQSQTSIPITSSTSSCYHFIQYNLLKLIARVIFIYFYV